MLDPFADKFGAATYPPARSLQGDRPRSSNCRSVPGSRFNNTVVVGSLAIGLWAMYPAYWFSYLAFEWNRKRPRGGRRACRVIDPFHVDDSIVRDPTERRAA